MQTLGQNVETDWRLILVNRDNPLPEDFTVDLLTLTNGEAVDRRIYPDLQKMFDDARSAGIHPTVWEGYRTREEQEAMMEKYIEDYQAEGYSRSEAELLAGERVARPGTSEHELGLAVDINAPEGEESQAVYDYLAAHAWEYGFILRYPAGKENITGIEFEPWHYRYVGTEAAREIYKKGQTMEEYLGAVP